MQNHNHLAAGLTADELIAAEVQLQDAMWGKMNERADATQGQMLRASIAQADLVSLRSLDGFSTENALHVAGNTFYPKDWGGFRDYGSDIANLVVAAAYLRQEIKRRLVNGEDRTRTRRGEGQSYRYAQPAFTTADPDYLIRAGLSHAQASNHEVAGLSPEQKLHGDRLAAREAQGVYEDRRTFTISPDVAVTDAEGRATGECVPLTPGNTLEGPEGQYGN